MIRPTPDQLEADRRSAESGNHLPMLRLLAEIDALTAERDEARTEASHTLYDLHYTRQERDEALAACANGDGRPICPPSKVLCRECLDEVGRKLREMASSFKARMRAEAGSQVDPLASAQSPRQLAYRPNRGRRVPPKPAAE